MSIDPSRTVAELVLERPSRARVFEHLGVDYCCGGRRSLEEACTRRGIEVSAALAALPRLSGLLEKVVEAHGADRAELGELRETFESLREEVEEHTADEEGRLFPAIRAGRLPDRAALEGFEHEHAETGAALERLRELTHGYDPDAALCNTHRATLDGLRDLEADLHLHIHEEQNVLFPRALAA